MIYLRKFIEKRRPRVIALCGENMDAYYLRRDIESLLQEISGMAKEIFVEIVDNEAAKIYMHSKQAIVSAS